MLSRKFIVVGLAVLNGAVAQASILGSFTFNDSQFGDTLLESDGGTFRATHWLNTVNADPGNPGALTGANFDSGIANIGIGGVSPLYTIGYSAPIVNQFGDDFGIITARFSSDDFNVEVSTDGINFSATQTILGTSAVSTGVTRNYFFNGAGPFTPTLWVTPVDLDLFGVASGDDVVAIRITSLDQGDLIRVAGLEAVPEPATLALVAGGLLAFAAARRRRA